MSFLRASLFCSLFRAERLSLLRLASYLPRIGTVPRSGPTAHRGGGLVAVVGKKPKRNKKTWSNTWLVLRRYQRNLVGGAGLAGFGLAGFGLFFVPKDYFREGSEEAFYFYFYFQFLCKGDSGGGGTRSCSNTVALVFFRRITTTVLLPGCQDFNCYNYPSARAVIATISTRYYLKKKKKKMLCAKYRMGDLLKPIRAQTINNCLSAEKGSFDWPDFTEGVRGGVTIIIKE